jgi:hypothetical protein
MPPPFDTADYIRRKKLTAIKNGNAVAASRKFRASTRFDSYDPLVPSIRTPSAGVCIDSCNPQTKHNLTNLMRLSYKDVTRTIGTT